MAGYIKLYRKLMDSPVWSDPHYLKLWMYCLLKATHKEREVIVGNQVVTLEPGQFITGRNTLTKELNAGMKPKQQLSESTWWRYLCNLEKWNMLNIKKTTKYSVISIVKWNEYQESEHQMNINENDFLQKLNRNTSESEHQMNNKNPYVPIGSENYALESEHQMNNKRTSNEQQMNTNKNVKNVKNIVVVNKEKDPIDLIAEKFSDLKTMQTGVPSYPNQRDYQAIAQIVAQGVPISQTIKLLEQCFEDFNRRNPNEIITSFNYCVKYIQHHLKLQKAKENARQEAKKGGHHAKEYSRGAKQTATDSSITGGEVGWLGKNRRKA